MDAEGGNGIQLFISLTTKLGQEAFPERESHPGFAARMALSICRSEDQRPA
jgi:hypothetical protein